MKIPFLRCLLVFLAANLAFFCSARKTSLMADFNISKPTVQAQQEIHVVWHGIVNITKGGEKQEIHQSVRKAQRGKGAFGGANLAHRPPKKPKNVASSLPTPPLFVLAATVMLLLFLVFPSLF